MVWPRRKIQLVASSAAPGIGGVRAILKEAELDFLEVEPDAEELSEESKDHWLEKPFNAASESETENFSPVTEMISWQEGQDHDFWREKAAHQGIKQQSIQSFIHTIFEDEFILWVSESTVLLNERPLLGHILNEAGFEPTILWPIAGEQWKCERKQGIHWIMPDSWLEGLVDKSSLGRTTGIKKRTSWVVRDQQIDFYRSENGHQYIGRLPRWPRSQEEEEAAQIIATCLDLGVSWCDIKSALSSIVQDNKRVDNLRWNFDDFRRNAGARGEKLSSPSAEYLENWWAR